MGQNLNGSFAFSSTESCAKQALLLTLNLQLAGCPSERLKQKRRSSLTAAFKTCAGMNDAGHEPKLQDQEDLYLTEQPYGLVCGVLTDLPANDWSNAALT